MKKSILLILFALVFTGFVKAQYIVEPDSQVTKVQTTEDEYNYITKQYKSFLPVKDGYKLENINMVSYTLNTVDRYFNFKKLIRTDTNEAAAILVEYVRISKGQTYIYYFCIPREDSSDGVWKLVQDTIEELGTQELRNAYIWALTKFISKSYFNQ